MNRPATVPPPALLWTLAVLINVAWALVYPLSKELLTSFPPMGLACWRLAGAALPILPFMRMGDVAARMTASDFRLLLTMGLVGCGLSIVLQFLATPLTLASNISLIASFETLFVLVLGHVLLRERIKARQWTGTVLAFAGVGLLTFDPRTLSIGAPDQVGGNLLMMASAFCFAVCTLAAKPLRERWSSTVITGIPFLAAALVLVPGYAISDPSGFMRALQPRPEEWAVIALVVASGAGCYFVWNWLLRYMSAGSLALSLHLQPVAGMLFSVWLLGEQITQVAALGAVLVLGGVAISELSMRAQPRTAST